MSLHSWLVVSILAGTAAVAGCNAKVTLGDSGAAKNESGGTDSESSQEEPAGKTTAKLQITGRSPVIVGAGTKVTLSGKNFRPTMTLALADGRGVDVDVESDTKASFVMPDEAPFGAFGMVVSQEGETQTITLVFDAGKTDYPLFSGPANEFCKGQRFYDVLGKLVEGTKDCATSTTSLKACATDGATDCIASAEFPSVDKSKLVPGNLKRGVEIAGVTGNFP